MSRAEALGMTENQIGAIVIEAAIAVQGNPVQEGFGPIGSSKAGAHKGTYDTPVTDK